MATHQYEYGQQQQQQRDGAARTAANIKDASSTFGGFELSCIIALQSSGSLFTQAESPSPSLQTRRGNVPFFDEQRHHLGVARHHQQLQQQLAGVDNQDSGIFELTAMLNK